jgi:hypothetical protein
MCSYVLTPMTVKYVKKLSINFIQIPRYYFTSKNFRKEIGTFFKSVTTKYTIPESCVSNTNVTPTWDVRVLVVFNNRYLEIECASSVEVLRIFA